MDSDRARQLIAAARLRPPPSDDVEETPEEVRTSVRAILSRAALPPPPDPLTGRMVGCRAQEKDSAPLTAAQLHRRIVEIVRQAGFRL